MKKAILPLLVILLVCAAVLSASSQEQNVSDGRTLGIGIQADFPWGGLVSARYWVSPSFGLEETAFVGGDASGLEGVLTTRALYRVADASTVDFYLAAGATLPFSPFGGDPLVFSLVGGIEFGLVAAPNLAWNLEFGITLTSAGSLSMCLGAGVHFYF